MSIVAGLWLVGSGQSVHEAAAQSTPLKGVVWTPPAERVQAEADLQDMHAMGVEAVRTPLIRDEQLLTHADTLGLRLFVDLPAAFLAAPVLRDSLSGLAEVLRQVLDRAEAHPSIRHIGLGQMLDTTDPATCRVVEQLAQQVQARGVEGLRTYSVTPFVATDRCGESVDLVLVDALDAADPLQQMTRWPAHQGSAEGAVGIGRLGAWVDPAARPGVRVPHSAEAQARYLERHLTRALEAAPAALFVYRWRDAGIDPFGRTYGLQAPDGTARPATEVVEGLFTGQQSVFAFPSGTAAGPGVPWLILLGWGLIALIGVVYAREPRFRHMVARYFRAHVFYQEAMRKGREVLVGSSLAVLAAEAASLGMGAVVAAEQFRYDRSVVLALQAVPDPLRDGVATLLSAPWSLGLVVGAGYALLLVLWMLALMVGSRWGRHRLAPEQAIMLVVWPRWPLLFILIGVLVAAALEPAPARPLIVGLLAAVGGVALFVVIRTLVDYVRVTRVPATVAALVVLACPLLIALYLGGEEVLRHGVPVRFVWRLLTQT